MRVLICGLPGSGKTTLARALAERLDAVHLDGDAVRAATQNVDFSSIGRRQQAEHMKSLAAMFQCQGKSVVASFVAPTATLRKIFDPDYTIWMDTVERSDFADTDAMWEDPVSYLTRFTRFEATENMVGYLMAKLEYPFDEYEWTKPTGLMIGRFQPWHRGHLELLKQALLSYDQICILIRSMPTTKDNPQTAYEVYNTINDSLVDHGLDGRVQVIFGPNVKSVVHGRTPGWDIARIVLSPEIEAISGTQIRNDLTKKPRVVSS